MEIKKSPKADLENKKNIFLQIGLIAALGTVLLAFEWKVSVSETSDFITISEDPTEIEIIPVTVMNQLPPPPPPAPQTFELLQMVDELDPMEEVLEINDADDETPNREFNINELDYGTEDIDDEIIPFMPSEDMPAFPGNVQKWIAQRIRYPQLAAEAGIQGKVYIQFVVEKNGSVSNIKVVRGVDELLDKEAVRVISEMPKWTPGKQRGKAVRVSYTMPITFRLDQ